MVRVGTERLYVVGSYLFCTQYLGAYEIESETLPGVKYKVDFGNADEPVECTCPSFYYSPDEDKWCKHITKILIAGCFYNSWSKRSGANDFAPYGIKVLQQPTNDPRIVTNEKCPTCGGAVFEEVVR